MFTLVNIISLSPLRGAIGRGVQPRSRNPCAARRGPFMAPTPCRSPDPLDGLDFHRVSEGKTGLLDGGPGGPALAL